MLCNDKVSEQKQGKIGELFVYKDFVKQPVQDVSAGDIVAVTGLDNTRIGDTVCESDKPLPLPSISVEEPTVSMLF